MLGVIADDLTGANDVGAMLHRAGLTVCVLAYGAKLEETPLCDALVLDTNSRLLTPQQAYQRVRQAAQTLAQLGCKRFYKKLCSVFRGNIGAELDALADFLEEHSIPVVAAFPENGRVTRNAVHYVHGKKLEDSEFRHDPIHPMTESNLVDILRKQTERRVCHIGWKAVQAGTKSCHEAMSASSGPGGTYFLFDAVESKDLQVIAQTVADRPVIGASSALAEYVGRFVDRRAPRPALTLPLAAGAGGVLSVCGSVTPQTQAQIAWARTQGVLGLELESVALLSAAGSERVQEKILPLIDQIRRGQPAIIHPSFNVGETQQAGERLGLTRTSVGQQISRVLGELTAAITEAGQPTGLIISGGETATQVFEHLDIPGNLITGEVEPGIPSGVSLGRRQLATILKPGGFGSPEFLLKSIKHIQNLQQP